MSEWKTYRLGDICTLVAGFAFKSNNFGDYPDKVIKIADIQPPIVDMSSLTGVDISQYNSQKLEKYKIQKGDYVLAMTGATIGKLGRILSEKNAYINQRVLLFKPIDKYIDKNYLYYYLCQNIFYSHIRNHIDSETAQPNISANSIGEFTLTLPPLEEQRRIAGILGSLDDKIELNRRINANLEAQAQALFRSWFVDNETQNNNPGFFNDIIQTTLSGDWGQETPKGNYISEVYCIRGADIPDIKCGDKGKLPTRYILEKNLKNKKLSENDLVVEISGGSPTQSTGRICLITRALLDRLGKDVICTNFCRALKPIPDYSFFIYLYWQYLYNNNTMFSYENGTTGGAPDKPCGVGRADANPKLLLNDT